MTEISPDNPQLPTSPDQVSKAFEVVFNKRDADLLEELFEPDAIHVSAPGQYLAGAERRAATREALKHLLPVTSTLRDVYVVGDVALMINDYVHEGTDAEGKHQRHEGTAADIIRRGKDGVWRVVVSNPPGTGRS